MITLQGKYTTADIMLDTVEPGVINQIYSFINDSNFTNPVKIMPDTHVGKGAVIGFTMPIGNGIIPNIVGVDLYCQMNMLKLKQSVLKDIDLQYIDEQIHSRIPMGQEINSKARINMERTFPWKEVEKAACVFTNRFNELYSTGYTYPTIDYNWFVSLCKRISIRKRKEDFVGYAEKSLGTLGGGK